MPDATIIPFEPLLPQVLPTIEGNVDYRLLREQLLRIDELLRLSGLEAKLMQKDLQRWLAQCKKASPKAQQTRQLHGCRALRCNIARILLQEDFRGFAARLADSPLLQHFCGISQVLCITVPAKSTLQRYEQWWPQTEVRQVIQQLVGLAGTDPKKLNLSEAVDLQSAFLDSTCLCAHIHYPVDWVLFRDITRTLMKAVILIREQGLKHRMPAPQSFLSRINKLCIQMTHAGNKDDSQRHRKKTLRQMDRVVRTVRDHAKRYRDLLGQHWQQTQWTQAQAEQVLGRMDQVLEQLPQARKQARQRILQGQAVPNEEKILSLYEPDVHVLVRKKAGAEVEFGNTLLLAENPQGLILDWELFQQSAPADPVLLPRSVGRIEKVYRPLKAVGADRGFDSQMNRVGLAEDGIYNGVCPRSPQLLEQRNHSWKFKWLQRRRAQIEARVSIIKNVFLRGGVRSKGFAHRQLAVTWSVLVHNLWVLARLPQPEAAEAARAA
jgi:IS5 family transposase